ncbi:MAG: ATP-binding protein, partial [Oceanicaulis sp.]
VLLDVINDILDLSKIEAGHMALDLGEVSPAEILDQVAALHRPQAEARGLAFTVEIDPGLDAQAARRGDRLRLVQVLGNLVSNAVKFTADGQVTLYAAPGDLPDEIVFGVRDSGCGMSADELARVFEPFAQADVSITRRYGGTGLGLSIVSRLVDLMNGSIDGASAPGEGSTFTVRVNLPRLSRDRQAAPPAGQSDIAVDPSLSGLRVLIADDSETNRLVAAGLLRPLKARVRLAGDGAEALDRFCKEPFDLVLMDIRMPRMAGIAALRAIRARPGGGAVPIIAMTANVMNHQMRVYEAEGFDGVCAKPLRADLLVEVIRAAIDARTQLTKAG